MKNDYKMMLAENEKGNIILKYQLDKKRNFNSGDKIGVVKVMLDDKKFYEEDLYVEKQEKQSKTSIWKKIGRWFTHD